MANHDENEIQKVPCKVCLKEIPISVAKMEEANEYVQYFCGAECYNKWKTQEDSSDDESNE